jgi:hypothetical protein
MDDRLASTINVLACFVTFAYLHRNLRLSSSGFEVFNFLFVTIEINFDKILLLLLRVDGSWPPLPSSKTTVNYIGAVFLELFLIHLLLNFSFQLLDFY